MPAANYVLLETIQLSQSAASVTFDNLPTSGYTDLKVVASARDSFAQIYGGCDMRFNGDSGTNYTRRNVNGNGSAVGSASQTTTSINSVESVGASATANTFSNTEWYIPNYRSSNYKSVSVDQVTENNATTAYAKLTAGIWSNTAAITSITILPGTAFVANSTFSLYGVAALGTTPTLAPKATGGNIVANDGTYWYHAFTSSGIFVPQVGLTADCLVIAGGGGTTGQGGGAGGAGGLLVQSSRTISTGTYSITIGAGGAGSPNNSSNGSPGENTTFDTVTALGGGQGGGASTGTPSGSSGGSGGGATYAGGTGGSPTQGNSGGATGYGFAGGNGINSGGQGAGGGGGAGAIGVNGTTSVGGNGGIGRTDSLIDAIGAATGTGQLVSGNYYFAGGGGGGIISGTVGAGGSGGGGAGGNYSTQSPNGTAGTANTGGGAGGRGDSGAGFSGGSGIVIIRYPIA